jgi:hypothetical protein
MDDYRTRSRAAFICAKGVSLDSLQRERMDQASLVLALARKVARRTITRCRRLLGR